jgi:hypothetical protein
MAGNTLGYEGYGWTSNATNQNGGNSLICIGDSCSSVQCISVTRCNDNNGVIFQNACFLCGPNQFYQNGQCLRRCGANETLSNGQCVCLSNYVRINGVCQLNTTCFRPNEVFNFNTASCVCIAGYTRVNGVCSVQCSANEVFNGQLCVCVSGYSRVNGVCTLQCSTNEVVSAGQCVCRTGYTRVSGVCQVFCPANSFFNNSLNRCICTQGYIEVNGTCYFQCRTNGYRVPSGACICLPNYIQDQSGTCIPQQTCGPNQTYNISTQTC